MFSAALFSLLLSIHGILLRESPVELANGQFESGDYHAALITLSAALASTPQDAAIYYWLARSYYEMRDFDKAVANAEQAVKLSSQNSEYNRWLGRAYGAKAERN